MEHEVVASSLEIHLRISGHLNEHNDVVWGSEPPEEHLESEYVVRDRLCGLVVRVPGYRSRGSGLIPGATRFSEK
jgi:hypothetical protein